MSQYQPYGPAPSCYTQVVVPPPYRSSTAHLVIAWTLAVLTAGYLLPWAIAATRNRPSTAAIALIDIFLGWTLVGWVVSLVMACGANPAPVVVTSGYAWPLPVDQAPRWAAAPPIAVRPSAPEPTLVDFTSSGYEPTQVLPGYDHRR